MASETQTIHFYLVCDLFISVSRGSCGLFQRLDFKPDSKKQNESGSLWFALVKN